VPALARLAVDAGAPGLVCAPTDLAAVRGAVGDQVRLVTPGVRPAGASTDDQTRVATPATAVADGADLLVIGRPITRADDPVAAASAIAAELDR
jgi:orotidine-5'-phosphate decarboxylase